MYTCIPIHIEEIMSRQGMGDWGGGTCSTLEYTCIPIYIEEIMRRRMVGFCSTLEYTYIPIYTGEIKRRRVGEIQGLLAH